MDFSYKVIRNRLGSLVANAIQKKIDNKPFLLVTVSSHNTDVDSSDVINALQKGIFVYYIIDNAQYANIKHLGSYIVIYNNGETDFIHNGKTISLSGGEQA